MASEQKTVDYITEQMAAGGDMRSRKMFGEYGVYCNDKVIAFVCDDQLFIKITDKCRLMLKEVVEAPPYPSAKPYFLINEEYWDDAEYMSELARTTAETLPEKKPKAS